MKNNKSEIEQKIEIIQKQYPLIFEVMGSPKTSEIIEKIAIDYGLQYSGQIEELIEQEQELTALAGPKIANILGQVLLGNLDPTELSVVLEEKLSIRTELAEKIAGEINQKIFINLNDELSRLYKTEKSYPSSTEEPPIQKKKDSYLESIE